MKRTLFTLLWVIALTLCLASPAFAGGDKVRGENGQGAVNQVQVQDPPPFQP